MPTIIVGSARDVVEHCAVPRFLFVDFPLGNPCGLPWDAPMQLRIVSQGLDVLEMATQAQTTVQSPERWPEDGWRERYMEVTARNRGELARQGELLRQRRAQRLPRSFS